MLTDIHQFKKVSEGPYDLLSTSIAVERHCVKLSAASQSPASTGLSPVESGHGAEPQLWIESGERGARPDPGTAGNHAAPTLAGVVLSGPRQSREAPVQPRRRELFCA